MTRGGKTTGLARYSTNLVGEKEKENRVRERQKKKEKKERKERKKREKKDGRFSSTDFTICCKVN